MIFRLLMTHALFAVLLLATALPVHAVESADFDLLSQRNIFSPRRTAHGIEPTSETTEMAEPPRDQMNLVGTWLTPEHTVAFITIQPGDELTSATVGTRLGEHEVVAIDSESVQLRGPEDDLTWRVGQRLEREEDGPWEISRASASSHSTESINTRPTREKKGPKGAGGGGDVMQRMMERRRRERGQ